jgi:Mce-associated membrane protein
MMVKKSGAAPGRATPHLADRIGRRLAVRRRANVAAPLRRLRRTAILLAVVAVLAAGTAGWAWHQADVVQGRENAAHAALAAATGATQAIFSYDYRRFDASVANGRQFVTGQFAEEYASTTANLQAAAEKEHAVVRAEVSAASVVQAAPDRVEVLVYVNQYRRNVNIDGEKVDQNRVVLVMVPVGGDWKVAGAAAV